jgi:hypothetical protein
MRILKKVNSYFVPSVARCPNLISWKHSFNRLNEEYEIARKKQQALDGLYEKGKISQSTHDSFNSEIAAAIAEIEKQQQDLLQKMHAKTTELQDQIKILEKLLANYEIQHVTGEIDENTYNLEINLLSNGLETAKNELQTVNDAVLKLCPPAVTVPSIDDIITEPVEAPVMAESQEMTAEAPIEVPIEETVCECEPAMETSIPESEDTITDVPPAAEMPAEIVDTPISEEIVVEAPTLETEAEIPTVEIDVASEVAEVEIAPEVVESSVEESVADVVDVPVVEEPIVEVPAVDVEVPVVEEAEVEAPADEPEISTEEMVVEEPTAEVIENAEVQDVAPKPEPEFVEEAQPEKEESLDEFEVATPEIIQKDLIQMGEEVAQNPFSEAPLEAQEEIAETVEVSDDTQTAIHHAKETITEAITDTYTDEKQE